LDSNFSTQFEQWRRINQIAEQAAAENNVDPAVIKSMIRQESVFNPRATSSKGAQGVMQLMPQTAAELGVTDVNDPEQNIKAGTKYFATLMKRYNGDVPTALAAYNAGMGNVDKGRAGKFPETQNYVNKITSDIEARRTLPNVQVQSGLDAPAVVAPQPVQAEAPAPSVGGAFEQWRATQGKPAAVSKAPAAEPDGLLARFKAHPLDTVAGELPVIGGALGGAVGGLGGTVAGFGVGGVPGAVAGATLGGAAGEAGKQLYERFFTDKPAPTSSLEAAKGIGKQGAIQGVTELAGQGVGRVVGAAGKGLVKRAFRPSADALDAVPTLVEDLAREGINPTAKGAATMNARTDAARQVAEDLVSDAGKPKVLPNGVRVTPSVPTHEVVQALSQNPYGKDSVTDFINTQFEKQPMFRRLDQYVENVYRDNPQRIGYDKLLDLRRGEGRAASDVLQGAIENPGMEKRLHVGMEAGARNALEKRVPGFAQANDVTANKLAVLQAVQSAVKGREASVGGTIKSTFRHMIPGAALTPVLGPLGGLGTWAATEALTNPTVEATLGRGAMRLGKSGMFGDAIRAGEVAAKETQTTNAARKVKKTKVDALYSRYRQDGSDE
jgi:hypothetical protein